MGRAGACGLAAGPRVHTRILAKVLAQQTPLKSTRDGARLDRGQDGHAVETVTSVLLEAFGWVVRDADVKHAVGHAADDSTAMIKPIDLVVRRANKQLEDDLDRSVDARQRGAGRRRAARR